MKIVVNNTSSRAIIGGKDNLLPFDVFGELYKYMSIKVPGADHSTKYREHKWDGMKHFFTAKLGRFATGFLPMIIKWADDNGVTIDEIIDERKNVPDMVPKELRIWTHYKDWELRENQQMVVNKFDNYLEVPGLEPFYFPRGIADAATNTGKNSIISGVIRNTLNAKTLILVGSMEIHAQLVEFLSVDFKVGQITSKKFEWGEQVTIAMVKTLLNKMDKSIDVEKQLKTRFNQLIVDECHEAGGDEYSYVIQKVDAGMRVFVSGSPMSNSNKLANMTIVGLSGKTLVKITKKELMDLGYSLKVKTYIHLNATPTQLFSSYDTQLYNCVWKSKSRCETIATIINERPGKKIMINFLDLEHGQFMYDYMVNHYGFEKMAIVSGADKQRKEKLEKFKSGEIEILFTSKILKQGINVSDINVLIYAQAGKAQIPLKQWAGRIERNDGVSEYVEIHDFWDEAKHLSKHSRIRINFYVKEEFEVNILYEHKRYTPVSAVGKYNRSRLDQTS